MTGLYLDEMADWFRAAGLAVVEQADWKTRARSSGGFSSGRPWCVMWHHTASAAGSDPANDAAYMSYGSPDKPIANVMPARDGTVWVLAAGATNTNGKGGPLTVSRGTIPVDCMNTYAVGMELQNNGIGEPYPAAQLEAAFVVSLTLCDRLGLAPDDVAIHAVWAPDRKIDPATAIAVQGGWRPGAVNSSGTWNQDDLRDECRRRATHPTPEPPEPTDEDDDMKPPVLIKSNNGTDEQRKTIFWWDGKLIGQVRTQEQADVGAVTGQYQSNEPLTNFDADTIQRMIDSSWAGGATPKGWTTTPATDTATR